MSSLSFGCFLEYQSSVFPLVKRHCKMSARASLNRVEDVAKIAALRASPIFGSQVIELLTFPKVRQVENGPCKIVTVATRYSPHGVDDEEILKGFAFPLSFSLGIELSESPKESFGYEDFAGFLFHFHHRIAEVNHGLFVGDSKFIVFLSNFEQLTLVP